jgi:hypothetical protein
MSPHTELLWVDDDGLVFVNYLDWVNADGTTEWSVLDRHRDLIAGALKEHRSNERVLRKFLWMRDYHNEFCRNHWQASNEDGKPRVGFLRSKLVEPSKTPRHTFRRWRIKSRRSRAAPKRT